MAGGGADRFKMSVHCILVNSSKVGNPISEKATPTPLTPSPRLWAQGLLGCVVLLHASAVPIDLIDDAYISFRYAWHLSHGNRLVFNVGAPVEGYSNLTWVLIAAVILKLGIPLEAGVRCVAALCLAATPILVQSLLLRIGVSLMVATGAGLLLALSSSWLIPMLNGLEGALFSFLLGGMTWLNWRNIASSSTRLSMISGFVGVVLSATRPEGVALYLLQLGASGALTLRTKGRPALSAHLIALITFLTGFAALTAWRFWTYGSLIPNTVLAKLGSPYHPFARLVLSTSGDGFLYSLGFLKATLPFWALALGALYLGREVRSAERLDARALAILSSVLWPPAFVIVFANNGDWMPDFRLLTAYVPLLVLSAGALLVCAPRRISLIALALAALFSVAPVRLERPAIARLLEYEPTDFYRKMCGLGSDIHAAARRAGNPVVAVEVLGVFGYCAPLLPLRDLNGLTDREIARHEPSSGAFGRKTSPSSLEAMRPDLIMHSDLNYVRILLNESPWFSREYLSLSCNRLFGGPLYIYVFVRRDSPMALPNALPLCPFDRVTPAAAFDQANCELEEWPYAFPRNCPPKRGPGAVSPWS